MVLTLKINTLLFFLFRAVTFFIFLSPSSLVPSFSGKHGCVYYMVQAVLKRPFHESQCVNRELCIISHIDVSVPTLIVSMSIVPSFFLPVLISTFCLWGLPSWTLHLNMLTSLYISILYKMSSMSEFLVFIKKIETTIYYPVNGSKATQLML